MTHLMTLYNQYFLLIKNRKKNIELRLFDEKRQKIKPGDTIIFRNTDTDEEITAMAKKIITAASFSDLSRIIPVQNAGFKTEEDLINALNTIYPKEKEKLYGVVAIEIELLKQ